MARLSGWFRRSSLLQRFSLSALLVMAIAMLILGWWVGRTIEKGVLHRTAAAASLYVENFIVSQLQELDSQDWLLPEHIGNIEQLLTTTSLGQEIVSIKIWGPGGRIVYGTDAGQVFPVKEDQALAWQGQVSADISNLEDAENVSQRVQFARLIEIYAPIRLEGSPRVIAVAEFYQTVDALDREVASAQQRSWLMVGAITLGTYLLLLGFVKQSSDTIQRQQNQLQNQVNTLNELLVQNESLNERIRRAATRTTEVNEQFLKRVSAELHDGPAQDLSFALLQADAVAEELHRSKLSEGALCQCNRALATLQSSLSQATQEMRAIASGLRLPELLPLSLAETVARVVRDHKRRTGSEVKIIIKDLPQNAPLSVKITLFRVVQEALNNAYRHGNGLCQRVSVQAKDEKLRSPYLALEVSDKGPGFVWRDKNSQEHLGLVGMRERVESLGGTFELFSSPGEGTLVRAYLPLEVEDE
jgi:signal transduction histidine kinase